VRMGHASSLLVLALVAAPASASGQLFERRLQLEVGPWPSHTVAADFDADGDLDLLVTQPDRLTIFDNDGAGNFSAKLTIPTPEFLTETVAADFDADGDLDLASLSPGIGHILFHYKGDEGYSLAPWFFFAGNSRDLTLADLHANGSWDLIYLTDYTQCQIENLYDKFSAPSCWGAFASVAQHGMAAVDMSGNGEAEIAFTVPWAAGHPDTLIVVCDGQAPPSLGARLAFSNPFAIAGGDVDLDGRADLVIVGGTASAIAQVAFLPEGSRSLKLGEPFQLGATSARGAVLADLDLDGRLDLITANEPDDNLSILLNEGGTFSQPSVIPAGKWPIKILAADLDANGGPDLVATNTKSGDLTIYFNASETDGPAVLEYCTAKVNSKGQVARIGATNLPSAGSGAFSIRLTNALRGEIAIALGSQAGPASVPFANGTLCVQSPLERLSVQQAFASGVAATAIPIDAAMVGTTRWYQWWYRDPNHPDGTGVGLSSALEVTFSW